MNIQTDNLIFIDIETVSSEKTFNELPEEWQRLWSKKFSKALPENMPIEDHYTQRAALYAEFSKVVCISFAYYNSRGSEKKLRVKSLCGDDEKELLHQFCEILTQFEKHQSGWVFAGHNIKEFDLPFLSRRMIINGLGIPGCMNFFNLKPWEYTIIDTMHYWRFGDYKNYTSLELLTESLGIPSPKSDITGSQVGEVFWERDFKRISDYCERDVVAVANIIQRFNGEKILEKQDVEIV